MRTRIASTSGLTAAVVCSMTLTLGSVLFAATDLRLLEAVQRRDRPAVAALLKERVDVNAGRGDGVTALAWAVHLDDVETTDLLIRAGGNVNAANQLGITPLMLAATNGNAAMTELLLKAKADPNTTRSTGETALVFASRTGKTSVIKLLVAAGARVNDVIGARNQTPLMWAAAEGHTEAVKFLLEVGADANAATKSNKVPAPNGHYVPSRPPLQRPDKTRSVITILWPKDGDGDMVRYDGGITPLFLAIDGGHLEVVRTLLDAGVKVDGPNPDGLTPMQFAMVRRNEPLALFLLERGADPNNAGPGVPPLHAAAYLEQPAMAKALIARGADVNVRIEKPYRLIEVLEVGTNRYPGSGLFTNIGSTPFMTAAKHGQIEIMRMLLANGANPHLTAKGGENALMLAAGLGRPEPTNVTYHVWKESEQIEAIKICLEVGLDINALNQWSQGALHGAAFQDFPKVIEFLAANGAWLDATDWQDQTALRIAQGHEICCSTFHRMPLSAAALVKAGADPSAGIGLKFAAHEYQDDAAKTTGKEK